MNLNCAPETNQKFVCFFQCQGVLSYDLTDPSSKRNLTNVEYQHFQHLLTSECSKRVGEFVCHMLEPECRSSRMKNLKPCRRICKGATALQLIDRRWSTSVSFCFFFLQAFSRAAVTLLPAQRSWRSSSIATLMSIRAITWCARTSQGFPSSALTMNSSAATRHASRTSGGKINLQFNYFLTLITCTSKMR